MQIHSLARGSFRRHRAGKKDISAAKDMSDLGRTLRRWAGVMVDPAPSGR